MKKLSLLIPVACLLAACGSGDGNPDSTASTGTLQSGGIMQVDSFTSNMPAVIGASSDTAEPMAVDAIPAGGPDNAEPSPVS